MEIKNQLGYIRSTIMGLSQEQLARKTGIDRRFISDFELGNKIPSLKQALLLSKALKCSVNDIFILEDEKKFS